MKKIKLIEDDYPLVKQRRKKKSDSLLYEYYAGITRQGSDDWVWQGHVVARNKIEAYALLKLFIIDKFAVFLPQAYEGHIMPYFFGEDRHVSKKPHGVYGI